MKLIDIVDIVLHLRLCDLIQLFLLGHDDKIYIDLYWCYRDKIEPIYEEIRIINDKLEPYYENEITWLSEPLEAHSVLTVYIKRKGEK